MGRANVMVWIAVGFFVIGVVAGIGLVWWALGNPDL